MWSPLISAAQLAAAERGAHPSLGGAPASPLGAFGWAGGGRGSEASSSVDLDAHARQLGRRIGMLEVSRTDAEDHAAIRADQ
jgi:hypothetical protein